MQHPVVDFRCLVRELSDALVLPPAIAERSGFSCREKPASGLEGCSIRQKLVQEQLYVYAVGTTAHHS